MQTNEHWLVLKYYQQIMLAQSTEAVEYTDYISAER